jgi:hypothetical protein
VALFGSAESGLSLPARERRPAPRPVLTTAVSAERFGKRARLAAIVLTALVVPAAQLPLALSALILTALSGYGLAVMSRPYHALHALIIDSNDAVSVHRSSALEPEPVTLLGIRLVSPSLIALRVRAEGGGRAQTLCIWWDQADARSHRLLRARLRHLRA